ncbi:MAG: ABC transporter permease, partial [Candidatus Margulisiibacteriota bacterium]
KVIALKDINLDIDAGEFVAVMGASGSGKSTLLAILGLLDRTDTGSYRLAGTEVANLSDKESALLRNKFFGFIFQMFNLLPRLNVLTNVMLPFIYAQSRTESDTKKVKDILSRIGMSDRLRHLPTELSGGQQQRAAIARALANKPLVILADEPTGNLDSKSTDEIMRLLSELNKEGNTILMITHNPELTRFVSRVIVLKDGQVIKDEKSSAAPISKTQIDSNITTKLKRGRIISFESVKNYMFEALSVFKTNKLRTLLSVLGILIGVAAVIAMLAIGQGAQKQVEKSLASLGKNVLMVRTSFRPGGISAGTDSVTRFTFEDLYALQKIDSISKVVPYVSGKVQAVYSARNWRTDITGTSTDYQNVRDSIPKTGRFFTQSEMTARSKVSVIGATVAAELFPNENPIGKQIRLNRINFEVIGVLPEKGISGFRNADDQIVIPVTTAMYRLLGTDYISYFDVQIEDSELIPQAQEEIASTIIKMHRLQESQYDQIEVRNMADIQKAAGEMMRTFALLLGAIAAVSLLVGGIGIMNIMLVMVMERTREIGLRKALGAQNTDIMLQFLVEGILICLIGGVLGIITGAGISWAVSSALGWNILISFDSIMLSFVFSMLTGLIFSLWPAWRASNLLPVIALRYE